MVRGVSSAAGELVRRDEERTELWSIKWESAMLEYSTEADFGGSMKVVSGTLYDEGKAASTFVAEGATVERGAKTLELRGGIVVKSQNPQSTLKCEHIIWHAEKGLIEAMDGIRVETPDYTVNGPKKVMARADLSLVGTPDLFEEKNARKE